MTDRTLLSLENCYFKLRSVKDGTEHDLTTDGLLVGREVECNIRLDQPEISRYHAKLSLSDSVPKVEDLNSTNGTFVNNKRIKTQTSIGVGDLICFHTLAYRLISDQPDSGSADQTLLAANPVVSTPPSDTQLNPSIPPSAPSTQSTPISPPASQSPTVAPSSPGTPEPSPIWHRLQEMQQQAQQRAQEAPAKQTSPLQPETGASSAAASASPAERSSPNASGMWEKIHALAPAQQHSQTVIAEESLNVSSLSLASEPQPASAQRIEGPALLVLNGALRNHVFIFAELDRLKQWTLGRSAACDIAIAEGSLMEHQITIRFEQNLWSVEAQQGNDDALLINNRTSRFSTLDDGDIIKVGPVELKFCNKQPPRAELTAAPRVSSRGREPAPTGLLVWIGLSAIALIGLAIGLWL